MNRIARLAFLLPLLAACYSIDATEWCVGTRYGKPVEQRIGTGLTFAPIMDVTCFPMTDRSFPSDTTTTVSAMTSDPLTVAGDVTIVYAYDAGTLFDSVFMGKRTHEAAEVELLNAIREGYRNAIANWSVQEIIDNRSNLSDSVQAHIQRKLGGRAIVKRVYVRNIGFPETIEKARIAAVQRTSELDAARKKLAIDSAEAWGTVIQARAQADAKRLEANAYSENPRLLDLEIAKAWKPCGAAATCVIGGSSLDVGLLSGRKP
jgi:regulator of protease activity HflC (stomatin/prohibitin superfamily)